MFLVLLDLLSRARGIPYVPLVQWGHFKIKPVKLHANHALLEPFKIRLVKHPANCVLRVPPIHSRVQLIVLCVFLVAWDSSRIHLGRHRAHLVRLVLFKINNGR